MDQEHVTPLLPAYGLGCLEPEERARVSSHLEVCELCRKQWADFAQATDRLGLAAPLQAPPDALEERLLQRIRTPLRTSARPARPALLSQWFRASPRWLPVSAVAAWVLVIALGLTNVYLLQQLRGADHPDLGQLHLIPLSGTSAAPQATGTLLALGDRSKGVLAVHGLPELDQSRQFQLWLIQDEHRISGGVFSVAAGGTARVAVDAPQPLIRYSAFGITIEPRGGSVGPTGSKVLGGRSNLG